MHPTTTTITTTTRRCLPSATWRCRRSRRCGRRLPQRPLPAVFSSISLSPHRTPQHYSRTAASGVSCVPSFSPLFDFLHKHTFSYRKRIQFYVFQHPRTGLLSFAAPCSTPPLPALVASISSFRTAAFFSTAHRNSTVSQNPLKTLYCQRSCVTRVCLPVPIPTDCPSSSFVMTPRTPVHGFYSRKWRSRRAPGTVNPDRFIIRPLAR